MAKMPASTGEAIRKPRRTESARLRRGCAVLLHRERRLAVKVVMAVLLGSGSVSQANFRERLNRICRADGFLLSVAYDGSSRGQPGATDDGVLVGEDDRLHPVAQTQLGQHVAHVGLRGALGDEQPARRCRGWTGRGRAGPAPRAHAASAAPVGAPAGARRCGVGVRTRRSRAGSPRARAATRPLRRPGSPPRAPRRARP